MCIFSFYVVSVFVFVVEKTYSFTSIVYLCTILFRLAHIQLAGYLRNPAKFLGVKMFLLLD